MQDNENEFLSSFLYCQVYLQKIGPFLYLLCFFFPAVIAHFCNDMFFDPVLTTFRDPFLSPLVYNRLLPSLFFTSSLPYLSSSFSFPRIFLPDKSEVYDSREETAECSCRTRHEAHC